MSLSLPRFQQMAQLVDSNGLPTTAFHIWWDTFASNLEKAFNDLSDSVAAIAAAQAAAAAAQAAADAAQTDASTAITNAATAQSTATSAASDAATAQTTATTAQTAATTAQSTADTVNRNDSISTSWTSPGTVLSAHDTGTNITVSIAAHTRKYTDATSKSVSSGSVTGLAYSTTYTVYYDQTSRAGGAVTYHATTDPNIGLANAAAGRHFCGKITTPAAGSGDTSGGVDPPGGGGGYVGGEIP